MFISHRRPWPPRRPHVRTPRADRREDAPDLPDRGNAPSLQACNKVAKDVSCAGLSRFLRHGIQTSKTPAAAAGGGSDIRLTLESEVTLGAGAGFEPATFRL